MKSYAGLAFQTSFIITTSNSPLSLHDKGGDIAKVLGNHHRCCSCETLRCTCRYSISAYNDGLSMSSPYIGHISTNNQIQSDGNIHVGTRRGYDFPTNLIWATNPSKNQEKDNMPFHSS